MPNQSAGDQSRAFQLTPDERAELVPNLDYDALEDFLAFVPGEMREFTRNLCHDWSRGSRDPRPWFDRVAEFTGTSGGAALSLNLQFKDAVLQEKWDRVIAPRARARAIDPDDQQARWPVQFETDRLMLRPPVQDDAEQIFRVYAQDADVTRYLMWRPHERVSDAEAYVTRCLEGWSVGTELTWMLTRRADHQLLGAIALRPEGHKASLGYVLGRAFWGQGLVPEAGHALLNHARELAGLHRVWAVCDVDNRASARVMEKLGMQREGVLRRWAVHPNVDAVPRDALCYSWIRPVPPEAAGNSG